MPHRRSTREGERQPVPSILEKELLEPILQQAQANLQRDGSLAPVLFFRSWEGELGIVRLELPATSEEKYGYFTALGLSFVAAGKPLNEALLLSETWYLSTKEVPRITRDVRASHHAKRREAITLVGRNEFRTRFTFVIQTFQRDARNQPIWEAREIEEYNVATGVGLAATGLLDALFSERSSVTS